MMTDRITATHLQRAAIVYVRQSSPEQVRNHAESTRIQLGLRDKAVAFGWHNPVTIVDDLGISAGGFAHRAGFQHMAAEVSLGHVGIILCFEASRLSRNSKDWAQLFEVCGHLDTLVADLDQVYDLALPDDRLILGVTGPGCYGGELFQELQRLEHQLRRTIVPRPLELHRDATVAPQPQALLGEGRAQHIPAQALQPGPIVGRHPHISVQIEALQVRLTGTSRRRGLDIRLPPESAYRSPGMRAQRHPPLDRGAHDPGQQGDSSASRSVGAVASSPGSSPRRASCRCTRWRTVASTSATSSSRARAPDETRERPRGPR